MDCRNCWIGFLVVLAVGTGAWAEAVAQDPIDRIREADLRADLFALAGDHTRGREGGTLDELRASAWLAERARAAGLEPAGDDGTYFQFFPVERFRTSQGSRVVLAGRTLRMGTDVVPAATGLGHLTAPVVVLSDPTPEALGGPFDGRAVVVRYRPAPGEPGTPQAFRNWARTIERGLANRAAALVLLIPEEEEARQWSRLAFRLPRGAYGLDPHGTAEPRTASTGMPVLYVRDAALGGAMLAGASLDASLFTESFTYPSVNVVAKITGTDPDRRGQHVLFSAHQDHDGERYEVDGDAIWNGADDNATTSVALLAIGRAFAATPGRRSVLFVWHGAEERGLMGSRWYVVHPTVPKGSIVAVLNGDMIGRNDPDTAALLGAVPPHRNSRALVDMALAANQAVSGFTVDHSWDDPAHREGWYYRSDHLPYARAGIPALFFTTLLHEDYHTPFDNPDRIDTAKLTRMTRWMYATGRAVAEADAPPALDPDFKLERCRDFTGNYCGG
ncbi:MAG TPA: M28 family peptidase [Vicinamibacterales bacterium]|nr:M28 family peptidase [Vicinamibacterales bacterium]